MWGAIARMAAPMVMGGIGSRMGGGGFGGGGGGASINTSGASNYLNQIPGVAQRHYQPYASEYGPAQQESRDVYGRMLDQYSNPNVNFQNVSGEYNKQAMDPKAFLNEMQQGYSPSEGYKFKENRMGSAMRNTAASGGFAGTQYDQEQQGQLIKDLLGEDMQQYLQNVMGIKQGGLTGLEGQQQGRERAYALQGESAEKRAQRAYDANNEWAQSHMNSLSDQAHLSLGAARQNALNRTNRNNSNSEFFGNLLGGIGQGMFGNRDRDGQGGGGFGVGGRLGSGARPGGFGRGGWF